VGVAEAAKKPVPKVTKEAKVKYKSKCKAPLKWNAVEAKCEKKVAKAKTKVKAAKKAGRDLPGMANISKLSMSDTMRLSRDVGLRIVGAQGMLHAYTDDQRPAIDAATGNPFLGAVTSIALWAQGPPIYGGTDQIQRNIIGERVLGLPKEPNNDKTMPFADLPKNA